jgi:hypothetical protein
MRELTQALAAFIYDTDISLAIESGNDCRWVKDVSTDTARVFETVAYDDLPMRDRDIYFAAAEAVIKGGSVSSFYQRTGVKRP